MFISSHPQSRPHWGPSIKTSWLWRSEEKLDGLNKIQTTRARTAYFLHQLKREDSPSCNFVLTRLLLIVQDYPQQTLLRGPRGNHWPLTLQVMPWPGSTVWACHLNPACHKVDKEDVMYWKRTNSHQISMRGSQGKIDLFPYTVCNKRNVTVLNVNIFNILCNLLYMTLFWFL